MLFFDERPREKSGGVVFEQVGAAPLQDAALDGRMGHRWVNVACRRCFLGRHRKVCR